MRSLQLVNRLHLGPRLTRRALPVRRLRLVRSLPLINKLHLGRRLAPKALVREKRLEEKNNHVSSELTARHYVSPLDYKNEA